MSTDTEEQGTAEVAKPAADFTPVLRELLLAHGPSGHETAPAAVWRAAAQSFGAEVDIDLFTATGAYIWPTAGARWNFASMLTLPHIGTGVTATLDGPLARRSVERDDDVLGGAEVHPVTNLQRRGFGRISVLRLPVREIARFGHPRPLEFRDIGGCDLAEG